MITVLMIYLIGSILAYLLNVGFHNNYETFRQFQNPEESYKKWGLLWRGNFEKEWKDCIVARRGDYAFCLTVSMASWATFLAIIIYSWIHLVPIRLAYRFKPLPDKEEFRKKVQNKE